MPIIKTWICCNTACSLILWITKSHFLTIKKCKWKYISTFSVFRADPIRTYNFVMCTWCVMNSSNHIAEKVEIYCHFFPVLKGLTRFFLNGWPTQSSMFESQKDCFQWVMYAKLNVQISKINILMLFKMSLYKYDL